MQTHEEIFKAVLESVRGRGTKAVAGKERGAKELSDKTVATVKRVLECALEASLRTEEATPAAFSIMVPITYAGVTPSEPSRGSQQRELSHKFKEEIDLDAESLTKLSPLSTPQATFFRVEDTKDKPKLVGLVRRSPQGIDLLFGRKLELEITVLGPAHLRIDSGGKELVYYRHGHILPKLADPFHSDQLPELKNLINVDDHEHIAGRIVIEELVRGMLAAERGGLLAFCNKQDDPALTNNRTGYELDPPLQLHGDLIDNDGCEREAVNLEYAREFERAYEYSAEARRAGELFDDNIFDCIRMSTIDGAMLFAPKMALVRFGVKLDTGSAELPAIYDYGDEVKDDHKKGGMRHRSAAKWVVAGPSRLAIVVSQDRKARIIHRIGDKMAVTRWELR